MRVIARRTLIEFYTQNTQSTEALEVRPSFVYIRFIGTHSDYDRIKDIENI